MPSCRRTKQGGVHHRPRERGKGREKRALPPARHGKAKAYGAEAAPGDCAMSREKPALDRSHPRSDLQRLRSCPAINGTRARQPWPEPHGYPGSTGLRVWALLIRVRGFFAVVDESSPPALTSWLNSGRFLFFFCPPCGEGKPRERKRTQGGWGRGRE